MILKNLDRGVYEKEVIRSGRPALLCFYQNSISQSETVKSIEILSRQFESIQFYISEAQDHELGFFFSKFHFLGTPIFIFIENGIEKGRLMGTVSTEKIGAFIKGNLSETKGQ
ncbi:MAG: thioredoxin [Desulfurivibrio sp.]|jgi:hypothetical protein|nr:MAG: thioredoxin [Desulfurivibrio sp.]